MERRYLHIRDKMNKERCSKVSTVVVTFNRKKLLLECLNALRDQTRPPNAIFIIDGPSTDGTPEALVQEGYIKETPPQSQGQYSWKTENPVMSFSGAPIRVVYVRLYEDVGGAGGFHEGVKLAYNEGYDWIWLMDDDAEPKKNALEELLRYIELPNVVALTPLKVDPKGRFLGHRGTFVNGNFLNFKVAEWDKDQEYVEIHHSSFVGPLISRRAVERVGFPKKKFFIWYDDVEYSLRLMKAGKMYLIPYSIIVHKEEKRIMEVKHLGPFSWRVIPYSKFWKYFFKYRNWAYLGWRYAPKWEFIRRLTVTYIKQLGGVLLFDDHKFKRIVLITSAYLDGIRGVFDNKKPNQILYGGKKA